MFFFPHFFFFSFLFNCVSFFSFQVRQWIAGRATTGSTPSTSRTPSPPPGSSSDWAQLHTDRATYLCGSHGKHTASSHSSGGASQSDQMLTQRPRLEKHTDMAELAKHVSEVFIYIFLIKGWDALYILLWDWSNQSLNVSL